MLALWLAMAHAYEPELNVHATVGIGGAPSDVPVVVAGGASLGLPTVRRLHVDVAGDFGLTTQRGRWVGATLGPRWYLWDPDVPVVSLFAAGGVALEEEITPLIHAGVAIDLEKSDAIRPRLQAGYGLSIGAPSRVLVQVGAVFGRKRYVAPPPPPPPPPPRPPEAPGIEVREAGMMWIPNPVCEWLPTAEGNAELERLDLDLPKLSVVSTRLLRAPDAPLEPMRLPEAERGPRPGQVVIVTSDADHVWLDEQDLVTQGGAAIGKAEEGMAWVEVRGGGRKLRFPVGVTLDNAVWLPVDGPEPSRVPFRSGQSTLARNALSKVAELADHRGGWSYQVQGSYSQEGNLDANQRLARARAEAVVAGLVDAGVPRENIELLDVSPPDPDLPPDEQRAAVVLPVEAL